MFSSAHLVFCGVVLIFSLLGSVAPTDHIVGANKGWNPGINYTLWANNHTFYVGDLIWYDNCTTEGALGNWSSGKDFIPLNKPQRYYFVCGNGQCYNGMKVSVLVGPLPPPPSSAVAANQSSSQSASPMALHKRSVGFRALLLAAVPIWYAWI